MMEAQYKIASGKLIFKVTGEKNVEIFSQVAMIQEVFEAESQCGICGCQDLRYVHRVAQEQYDYYELRCTNRECGGRFDFGQRKGTFELYPKRKGDDGRLLPNNGWYIFESGPTTEAAPVPPPGGQRQQLPPTAPPPPQRQAPPQPAPQQRPAAGNAQSARDLSYAPDQQGPPPPRSGRRY